MSASLILRIVQLLNSLITVKIITSFFSVKEYGEYSYIIAIVMLISVVPFTGLNQGLIRFGCQYGEVVFSSYAKVYLCYIFFVGVLLEVLGFNIPLDYIIYFTYFVFSNLFFWKVFVMENVKTGVFFYVFDISVKLIIFVHYGAVARFENLFYILSLPLIFILPYLLYRKKKENIKIPYLKIFNYSKPIIFWSIFIWMQSTLMRLLIEDLYSYEILGYFTLLSSLILIFYNLQVSIINGYILKLFLNHNGDYKSLLIKWIKLFIVFNVIVASIVFSISNFIIKILSTDEYLIIAPYLSSGMLLMMPSIIGQLLSVMFNVRKKNEKLYFANILPGFTLCLFYLFQLINQDSRLSFEVIVFLFFFVWILNGSLQIATFVRFKNDIL